VAEGAAAVSGLFYNMSKTETMGRGVRIASVPAPEAWAERFELRTKKKTSYVSQYGWMADSRWALLLGCRDDHTADIKTLEDRFQCPTIVLKFDRKLDRYGDPAPEVKPLIVSDMGRGGHCRDISYTEGAPSSSRGVVYYRDAIGRHVLKRLGFFRCLNGAQFKLVDCTKCGCSFRTDLGLKQHSRTCSIATPWTARKSLEYFTNKRMAWLANEKVRGRALVPVEKLVVTACNGAAAASTGKFVYLGSLLSTRPYAAGEIKRRSEKAWGVFGMLSKVWDRKNITHRTRGNLFLTYVLSVLLYNAEVWPLKKSELKQLSYTYYALVARLFRRAGGGVGEGGNFADSRTSMLETLRLPSLEGLLRSKRLRWVGHCLRRDAADASRVAVTSELESNRDGLWSQLVWGDLDSMGWDFPELVRQAAQRVEYGHFTEARKLSNG
jgi:hypothetical protein